MILSRIKYPHAVTLAIGVANHSLFRYVPHDDDHKKKARKA